MFDKEKQMQNAIKWVLGFIIASRVFDLITYITNPKRLQRIHADSMWFIPLLIIEDLIFIFLFIKIVKQSKLGYIGFIVIWILNLILEKYIFLIPFTKVTYTWIIIGGILLLFGLVKNWRSLK